MMSTLQPKPWITSQDLTLAILLLQSYTLGTPACCFFCSFFCLCCGFSLVPSRVSTLPPWRPLSLTGWFLDPWLNSSSLGLWSSLVLPFVCLFNSSDHRVVDTLVGYFLQRITQHHRWSLFQKTLDLFQESIHRKSYDFFFFFMDQTSVHHIADILIFFYCQLSHLVTAVHPIGARGDIRCVSSCRGEQRCIAVFNETRAEPVGVKWKCPFHWEKPSVAFCNI